MMKKQIKLALIFTFSMIGWVSCTNDEDIVWSEQTNKLTPNFRQLVEEKTDTFAVACNV